MWDSIGVTFPLLVHFFDIRLNGSVSSMAVSKTALIQALPSSPNIILVDVSACPFTQDAGHQAA